MCDLGLNVVKKVTFARLTLLLCTKQCLAPFAEYICNVWQTGPVGYVDVLDTVLPLHTQYLALA